MDVYLCVYVRLLSSFSNLAFPKGIYTSLSLVVNVTSHLCTHRNSGRSDDKLLFVRGTLISASHVELRATANQREAPKVLLGDNRKLWQPNWGWVLLITTHVIGGKNPKQKIHVYYILSLDTF